MVTLPEALLNLAVTVSVECLLALLIVRSLPWRGLLDVAWINLLTNPLGHLAVAAGAGFWTVESGVVFVEICLLRLLLFKTWARAAASSVLFNSVTIILSFWGPRYA